MAAKKTNTSVAARSPCAIFAGVVAEHGIHGSLVNHEVERSGVEWELSGVEHLHSIGGSKHQQSPGARPVIRASQS